MKWGECVEDKVVKQTAEIETGKYNTDKNAHASLQNMPSNKKSNTLRSAYVKENI